jgi:hypothetical protein
VFFSVKELELKKVRFEVAFPPGEIEYDEGLRQATPLEVRGSAELLAHTLGEIRIRGHLTVRFRLRSVLSSRCPGRLPGGSGN